MSGTLTVNVGPIGTPGSNPKYLAFCEKLATDIKWTAGTRFIAEQRFLTADRNANYAIAFSSSYVIIYTVLPFVLSSDENTSKVVNAAAIVMSILLLAISLLQAKNEYASKALIMRWSALELNSLHREISAAVSMGAVPFSILHEFLQKRNHIFAKYELNHSTIDFELYKLRRPWDFDDLLRGLDPKTDKEEIRWRQLKIFMRRNYVEFRQVIGTILLWTSFILYGIGATILVYGQLFSG